MVCSSVERGDLDATDTFRNLKDGRTDLVTRAELQRNAANILRFAMDTPAMDAVMGNKPTVKHIDCPFSDDTIEAKVDVYYNIDEDPVIKVNVNTEEGNDFVFGITSDKHGLYKCELVASSDLTPLAQLPIIPMGVITFTGTDGEIVTKEKEIGLLNKHSIFRLHFGKRGLKLHELRFTYKAGVDEIKFEDM